MSLREAKLPNLKDKLEAQEEARKAEELRVKLEKEDEKSKKVIKKAANKK